MKYEKMSLCAFTRNHVSICVRDIFFILRFQLFFLPA